MKLEDLRRPLEAHEIDFRIQSINKGGYATILAYKDARVDINRLDEVCGPLNWKREHTRGNANCIVSIWNDIAKQWVSKEDTGVQSYTEKEKGLASDSFKRACFNWGIGIELYDYPLISVKLNADEFEIREGKAKQTWNLKLRDWTWHSTFQGGKLATLTATDNKGKQRYHYELGQALTPQEGPGESPQVEEELPIVWLKETQLNKALQEGKETIKKTLDWYDGKTDRDGSKYAMKKVYKEKLKEALNK